MKKIALFIATVILLASCGNGANRNSEAAGAAAEADSTVVVEDSLSVAADTLAVEAVAE